MLGDANVICSNFYFATLGFVDPIFRFWFLVTFGIKVTKIQKYYIIFVYILQGKMGNTEKKNGKKITGSRKIEEIER